MVQALGHATWGLISWRGNHPHTHSLVLASVGMAGDPSNREAVWDQKQLQPNSISVGLAFSLHPLINRFIYFVSLHIATLLFLYRDKIVNIVHTWTTLQHCIIFYKQEQILVTQVGSLLVLVEVPEFSCHIPAMNLYLRSRTSFPCSRAWDGKSLVAEWSERAQ